MQDITKIIESILSNLIFDFKCTASVASGSNFILYSTNTYWLRPAKTITIGGKQYKIISLAINESITVKPIGHNTNPGTGNLFQIPPVVYKHGTARAINTELAKIKQKDKVPFAWLLELVRQKKIKDPENPVDIEADIRLFLFDEADPAKMVTEDHYNDVIRPLMQLADEIVNYINSNLGLYNEVLEYETTGLADWGQFNEIRGFESKILDEEWSGIELKFTLEVLKENEC